MLNRVRFILLSLLVFRPVFVSPQIILTEIMFDPAGSEYTDEFVEIYNLSNSVAVDLTGWRLADGSNDDGIVDAGDGLVLQPGRYGVILDPDYFGHSTTYDHRIPEGALLLTVDGSTLGSGGLSNSQAERVTLLDAGGGIVAQYTYSIGNPSGHSDEKVDFQGPDVPENWDDSCVSGGTPGFLNSVARAQFDLEISGLWIEPARPRAGEDAELWASFVNAGSEKASGFTVWFFQDANHDSLMNPDERMDAVDGVYDLEAGDSQAVSVIWSGPESGFTTLAVQIDYPEDERPDNNRMLTSVAVGFSGGAVVINEIMYDPLPGGPEWVELHNPGDTGIDLREWVMTDSDTSRKVLLTSEEAIVPGRGWIVVSEDSLMNMFPVDGIALINRGFPALNNDADAVVLFDPAGFVIDRVDYDNAWGGGDGFSLERIQPRLPSGDASNWSTSVAPEGGTPGRQNSVFTSSVASEATLAVSPNPFSPDEDGMDDVAIISYGLPMTTSYVNLRIYDVRGRIIRTLMGALPSGSQGSVIWDGRDDAGRMARMGIYIVTIEGLNGREGIVASAKTTVVLAGRL